MVLLLRRDEVADLLDLPTAVRVTEELFAEQARGQLVPDSPRLLRLNGGVLRVVSGALLGSGLCGVRAGTSINAGSNVALLYDTVSGELRSILSYPFSSLRIGATVALATRLLARPQLRVLGIIGSGRNARTVLEAVIHARPSIERVLVFSRRADHRDAFAASMRAVLGKEVVAMERGEDLVRQADLVLTATDPREPVLRGAWLRKGQLVVSIGRPNELDADTYRRADLIVTTSKKQEQDYYDRALDKPLLELVASEEVTWFELGEAVTGRLANLADPADRIVVFREAQGGVGDLALAQWAEQRARELGRGQEYAFG